MEIMPVSPCIELCLAFFFRLFSEMGYEFLLVIGDHSAIGHHQRCMKILMVDSFQCIDVKIGCSINKVIHSLADSFFCMSTP